jgi:hypothetical protein
MSFRHDDLGSCGDDDSEVKMTRPATGALRRPLRGNKTQGGTIPQEAARRLAVASRVTTGASSSRDGRENSAWPSLDN